MNDKQWLERVDSRRGPQCAACVDPSNKRLRDLLKVVNEAKVRIPSTKLYERMCELDGQYGNRVSKGSLARHFRDGHEPLRPNNANAMAKLLKAGQ